MCKHNPTCKCEVCQRELENTRNIVMTRLDEILDTIPKKEVKHCETSSKLEELHEAITGTILKNRRLNDKKPTFFQEIVVQ